MIKNLTNRVIVKGRLYDHKLVEKVSGEKSKNPGTSFITGEIMIATDKDCLNVVSIHYTYVTPTTANGKPNRTYNTLKNIVDGSIPTLINAAPNSAEVYVSCDTAIGIIDFPNNDGEWITSKRNEGGFISIVNENECSNYAENACFECVAVINGYTRLEPDEEKNLPERMILNCAIFDFRNSLMPIKLTILNPNGMNYIEDQEVSSKNPLLTRVKGTIISTTSTRTIEENGAWGEASVRTVKSSHKDYIVTWMQEVPYEWDTPDTLTHEELQQMVQNRELYLASEKKRRADYEASLGRANSQSPAALAPGGFNF